MSAMTTRAAAGVPRVVAGPDDLARLCPFPVLVPGRWPAVLAPPLAVLSVLPGDGAPGYLLRSGNRALRSLEVTGARPSGRHVPAAGGTVVAGAPWPSWLRSLDRGFEVQVDGPGVRVFLVATGMERRTVLELAREMVVLEPAGAGAAGAPRRSRSR